jgi:hypothetical protein
MGELNGIFSLRTPQDLVDKLDADLKRMTAFAPTTIDAQRAAFDFFIAAHHLPEWCAHKTGRPRTDFGTYGHAKLVAHIANGAKHFRVSTSRHKTVKDSRTASGVWAPDVWAPDVWAEGVWGEAGLVIELEDGTTVDVLKVAQEVLEHWRRTLL